MNHLELYKQKLVVVHETLLTNNVSLSNSLIYILFIFIFQRRLACHLYVCYPYVYVGTYGYVGITHTKQNMLL